MLTDQWLRRQYVGYNKRYFHALLPAELPVSFGSLPDRLAAQTSFDGEKATQIVVQKCLRTLTNYTKMVLLHEMAHVAIGYKERQYHGPLWKKERKRLIDAGAFTSLI